LMDREEVLVTEVRMVLKEMEVLMGRMDGMDKSVSQVSPVPMVLQVKLGDLVLMATQATQALEATQEWMVQQEGRDLEVLMGLRDMMVPGVHVVMLGSRDLPVMTGHQDHRALMDREVNLGDLGQMVLMVH